MYRWLISWLCLLAALILAPCSGWAYRPFESTDADVTGPGQFELELGIFGWDRAGGDDTIIVPQIVINYGLTQTLEVIGEFDVIHPPVGGTQIADPGLFLKSVLRRGALQNRPGLSVALDVGLRRGISDAADDWAVNLGVTVSF